MVEDMRLIELKGISKSFGDNDVLKDIDLYIRKKEFVTLLGPSGCGKTTMLRIIGGFETADKGQVFFEGEDIKSLPPYKRRVNTVFQKYALFTHLNVFENIAFGLKLKNGDTLLDEECRIPHKISPDNPIKALLYKGESKIIAIKQKKKIKAEIKKRVEKMLKLVRMEGFEKRSVDSLSGGQQQRIAIARALVNEPEVLLLDEPLGALDLKLRKQMQTELKDMQQKLGITFIYVTHDQEEALTMSDTIVVMNEGRVQQVGDPKKIYDEPRNAFVADFIGESNILKGTMIEDELVEILGHRFECVDEGFDDMEPVDVVVRPEDIMLVGEDVGMLTGVVEQVVFKGMHYEMRINTGDYLWKVQSTAMQPIGSKVGLSIVPFNIHIMHADFSKYNIVPGQIALENKITLPECTLNFVDADKEFEITQRVDVLISPEDISFAESGIKGTVKSCQGKKDGYDIRVETEERIWKVRAREPKEEGDEVYLTVNESELWVMPKEDGK